MPKIMIFGCNGFVGTSLCLKAAQNGWQVFGADSGPGPAISDIAYFPCDIRDQAAVLSAVVACNPDYIVNVAAIANIDLAEQNQALAHAVNVTGAENIAKAANACAARYLFFSSDAVFDGMTGGYTESSPKASVNYYGQTKSEAETCIARCCKNYVIIRISLVLGFSPVQGNSTLDAMDRKFAAGQAVEGSLSDIRTPIDITTLCSCVLELYDVPLIGVIHLGSTQSASRYEIAHAAALALGYPESLVICKEENAPEKAPRHKKGILSVSLAQSLLKTPLLNLHDTVEQAVASKMRR